jgi:hypothetical protein
MWAIDKTQIGGARSVAAVAATRAAIDVLRLTGPVVGESWFDRPLKTVRRRCGQLEVGVQWEAVLAGRLLSPDGPRVGKSAVTDVAVHPSNHCSSCQSSQQAVGCDPSRRRVRSGQQRHHRRRDGL